MIRARESRRRDIGLIDGPNRLQWETLFNRIQHLAGALRSHGIRNGERVAILAVNSHRVFECFYATIWAGGILAPLNHRLSGAELAGQIADSEPDILFVSPEFLSLPAEVRAAARDIPIIVFDDVAAPEPFLSYEALIASADTCEETQRQGDDGALLFYTGGTTGEPKGVLLSHENMVANSLNFISHIGMDERTVHLHCGPLFHVAAAARLFSVTQAAATHVVLPRFVVANVLQTIAAERVTLATFVPTMIRALLDVPDLDDFDLSSLRYITYGAAPISEALVRELMRRLPDVRLVQSYGMTETSPIATMLGYRDHIVDGANAGRLRSAGRAALLAEVRVVDSDGNAQPIGATGEIIVRGPMVMRGYWRNDAATAKVLRQGWMYTGDIGYLDEDGYLFVVDRLKDVIISGGENVYSQEVENAISTHYAVWSCAVIGLPHEKWGEMVHAIVVPRAGLNITAAEIITYCRSKIAAYKCPKSVEIRFEELPISGANKVLKSMLRAETMRRSTVGAPATD
ncbi:long-chain-fatty-acid--CoA ligase [Methylovirgula ligni]|uniref:long-chain-fatty-acid--CoA ligase n=1 Tax=Methylovirgula ligni TaxID=569860 RepID=UPI0013EC6AE9|nr:long-chain-fatty-acid--CoA ligase [Methylovirgula ligni]